MHHRYPNKKVGKSLRDATNAAAMHFGQPPMVAHAQLWQELVMTTVVSDRSSTNTHTHTHTDVLDKMILLSFQCVTYQVSAFALILMRMQHHLLPAKTCPFKATHGIIGNICLKNRDSYACQLGSSRRGSPWSASFPKAPNGAWNWVLEQVFGARCLLWCKPVPFPAFTFHYATKQLLRDSLYPLLCPNFEKCKQNINNCSARVVSHRLQF